MAIARIKLRWSGWTGGPGYSVLHFADEFLTELDATAAQDLVVRTNTFANAIKALVPSQVSLQCTTDCEIIDEKNGSLIDVRTVNPGTPIVGTATSTNPFAAALGMNITWRTALVRNSRRVRGRTFLVPLTSGTFDNTGTPSPGSVTLIQGAADALRANVNATQLIVWARPTGPQATDGAVAFVNSASVPDKGSILTSRRE